MHTHIQSSSKRKLRAAKVNLRTMVRMSMISKETLSEPALLNDQVKRMQIKQALDCPQFFLF